LSRDASGWTDTKEMEKIIFMIKKIMKIGKNKSKEKEIDSDASLIFFQYLLFYINHTSHLIYYSYLFSSSFFHASFSKIFVSFPREIKVRCV